MTLELGGKSPIVIFDDCDFDSAVNAALAGNFYSTGQVCSNGTRVFVHEAIYDAFVDEVVARSNAIVVVIPLIPKPRWGHWYHSSNWTRWRVTCLRFEAQMTSVSCVVVTLILIARVLGGYYVSPAVVVTDNEDHSVVTDEVFGP